MSLFQLPLFISQASNNEINEFTRETRYLEFLRKSHVEDLPCERYIISFPRRATWVFDHSITRVKYTAKRHGVPPPPKGLGIGQRRLTISLQSQGLSIDLELMASINYRNSDRVVIIIHSAASLPVFIGYMRASNAPAICGHPIANTSARCSILLITYDAVKIRSTNKYIVMQLKARNTTRLLLAEIKGILNCRSAKVCRSISRIRVRDNYIDNYWDNSRCDTL